MINHKILMLLGCVALATLSGCAFTNEQIDLAYNQSSGVVRVKGADRVSVNVEVTDQRPDKLKVSSKKNGYGMETASITASEDVSVTIRKAIEGELEARGFRLGSNTAQVIIDADLTRFYNDHKRGFFSGDAVADFSIYVVVKSKNGEKRFSKHIVAQGTEPNIQLASGNNAKLALEQALANGLKMLFEDQSFISALTASSR